MALAKKGSRAITVDGQKFRWSVRPKPTYSQGLAWSPLSFAVEAVGGAGCALHVTLARPRPDNWLKKPSAPVTPREVAAIIRRAMKSGWKPAEPGSPFEITEDDTSTEPSSSLGGA
jgi:hypothetical protein